MCPYTQVILPFAGVVSVAVYVGKVTALRHDAGYWSEAINDIMN